MLKLIGKGKATTCDGVTRRDVLQAGALSAIGLGLPQYLQAREQYGVRPGCENRSVIMIFNLGAPSQLDTWDMKPEAPAEIRGPFRPLRSKIPGVEVSELFPGHTRVAEHIAYVRSCHHTAPAVHDAGWEMMQTGRFFTGGIQTPHAGCVASYLLGRRGALPAHIILPEPMGRGGGNLPSGQSAGFLGKAHDPFALMADPSKPKFQVPDMLPPPEISPARLTRRRKLREIVDGTIRDFEATESAKLLDQNFRDAYRLMTSREAREAFDLSREPSKVRERYGMTRFGQCCLLARRLIEAGVRFVTINTFLTVFNELTWDIHGSLPFTSIEGMKKDVAPMYDQGYSALIADLHQRGLLADTLVCNLAEFGRTPKINPAGGRDHWPQCWTVYFAGGGVQGGQVIGRSDPIGAVPAERPVEPANVIASVFHSLGLDLDTHLPGPGGRPFPLVDIGKREIHELF